jgi:hypothetical protein
VQGWSVAACKSQPNALATKNETATYELNVNDDTNITGNLMTTVAINTNGNKLNFPNTLDQYNNYGFGIAANTSVSFFLFIFILKQIMKIMKIIKAMQTFLKDTFHQIAMCSTPV